MFCVECGSDVEEEDGLIGGLCLDCYLERNEPLGLPQVLDVVRCPHCGSVRAPGGWRSLEAREGEEDDPLVTAVTGAVEDELVVVVGALVRAVSYDVRPEDERALSVGVDAELSIGDRVVQASASTRVRVRGEVCPTCSRRAGSYYEALVQFRGSQERPLSEAERADARELVGEEIEHLGAASRDVFLMKVEEQHGGLDFYISTHAAGAQVARVLRNRFGASVNTSTTTAGRRDGRELQRITHSVRLPDLRRGDFAMLDGKLLRVVSATDREATVEEAAGRGRRRRLTRGDRPLLEHVGDASSVEEAVVVSESPGELQVLDPVTLRTVELTKPPGYIRGEQESVRVLRVEEDLHLVD